MVEGTIYVLGGLALDGRSLTTVEALAPDAGAWQPRAPLPEPRDHLAAVDLGGRLYVVGGSPGWFNQQTSTTLWRYDAGADSWEARRRCPWGGRPTRPPCWTASSTWPGGSGPIPSACRSTTRRRTLGPEGPLKRPRSTWRLRRGGPLRRRRAVGGRGQRRSAGKPTDPQSDAWRTLAPMPTPAGGLARRRPRRAPLRHRRRGAGRFRGDVPPAGGLRSPGGEWTSGAPPAHRAPRAGRRRPGWGSLCPGRGRRAGLTVSGLVEILTPEGG